MRRPLLALVLLSACSKAADVADTEPDTDVDVDPPWDDDWDDDWADLQEQLAAQLAAEQTPGMQVAVVLNGELAFTASFGVTAWGSEEAVTDKTLFRWASVTKMHTAAAALRLQEEGALDLHASATDYVPGFSLADGNDASSITLHHGLTHTSALVDELDWNCNTSDEYLGTYVDDRLASFWMWAPAGSFYNYSNTGFNVAGAALEEVTGDDFADLIDELVLAPSGMEHATVLASEAALQPHADGTTWWDDAAWNYDIEEMDCAASRPAAWLHATATDLARTAEWQLADGGDVLEPASVEAMRSQVDTRFLPDEQMTYGYGLFSYPYRGVTVVMHDGWVTGFTSIFATVPERDFGIVIVANSDWTDVYTPMYDALDSFLDLTGLTPDQTTSPSTWGGYTGTYEDPHTLGTVVVTLEGTQLWVDFADQGHRSQLWQDAGDYFWFKDPDGGWVGVRFIPDETGASHWFVTRPAVAARFQGITTAPPPEADEAAWRSALARHALPERPAPGRIRPGG